MSSASNYLENALLNLALGRVSWTSPVNVYIMLFTTTPGEPGGGTEVSGGGYQRFQITNNVTNWPSTAVGIKQNAVAISFPQATANWGTVVGWGIADDPTGGNMMFYGDLVTNHLPFTGKASDDIITCPGHTFVADDTVRISALLNGTLPTGLAEATTYYVRDVSGNTFKLAATAGGSAINLTADGAGYIGLLNAKTVTTNDTFTIPIAGLTIRAD